MTGTQYVRDYQAIAYIWRSSHWPWPCPSWLPILACTSIVFQKTSLLLGDSQHYSSIFKMLMSLSQIVVLDPSCPLKTQSSRQSEFRFPLLKSGGVGGVCCSPHFYSVFLLLLFPFRIGQRETEGSSDPEPGSQANVSWEFPSHGPTPRGGVHSRTS